MRKLTDHVVNGLNEHINVTAVDEPGIGGACHVYELSLTCPPAINPGDPGITSDKTVTEIRFQNGSIKEAGINGISQEALIAVIIDRLRGFQSGKLACRENAIALTKLEEAQMWLQKRTRDRMARGVEGTTQK